MILSDRETQPFIPMNPLHPDFKKIGQGTFGDVFLNKTNNKVYKYSSFIKENGVIIDNALREATFYKLISAAKRNRLKGIVNDVTCSRFLYPPLSIPNALVTLNREERKFIYIMDYYGQTLSKIQFTGKTNTFYIFKQVLEALVWLHRCNMSHGDLKPSNIVVKQDSLTTTLVDYGSIAFTNLYPIQNHRCTIYYVSPEELAKKIPAPSSDMWSFGVTLFEHVTGESFILGLLKYMQRLPNEIDKFVESAKQVTTSHNPFHYLHKFFTSIQYSNVLSYLYKKVKDRDLLFIISNCLLFDTSMRMSAAKCMPFFNAQLHATFTLPDDEILQSIATTLSPYSQVKHAGIDGENRKKIIQFYLAMVETKYITEFHPFTSSILPHSIMMFDRYCFRNAANFQYDWSVDLIILGTIFLSVAILKGAYMTTDMLLRTCENLDKVDVELFLLDLIEALDFKLFNVSPDIYSYQPSTVFFLEKFLTLAQEYPCIHSTVEFFSNMLGAEK